jgi:glycosyltransferase involved in cell wall biosynthesis
VAAFGRFVAGWKPDFVISCLPHNNLAAIAARILRRGRWHLIVTEHAPVHQLVEHYKGWRYRILPIAIRLFYPLADAVVAVSGGVAQGLERIAPRLKPVEVIFNPLVDASSTPLMTNPQTPFPWPEEDGIPVVVAAGRFAPEKDFPLLVRAVARLRAGRRARLVILGSGPDLEHVSVLARELGFGDDAYFPGWVANPSQYIRRASVLAMTSRFEGFGNVLVEALACGTPVVAIDCPVGPREILGDGRFGLLVPLNDETGLVEALAQTLDHPPAREFLIERAQAFSIAASVGGYQRLIDSILARRRPRPAPSARSAAESPLRVSIYMNDLAGGGVERMRLQLIDELRSRGVDVTLLLHSGEGQLRKLVPKDLRVVAFDTHRTLMDLVPLIRHLRRERPDVLISSLDHNNVVAGLAGVLSMTQTPVVICQHNSLSSEAETLGWKYQVIPRCYRLLAPFLRGIVAVSDGVAKDMAKVCGLAPDRVTVIYNPVINLSFRAAMAAPVEHPWFTTREGPVFVTAGRLVPQKDQATLLRALAIARKRINARLIILGTGPLQASLEKTASDLGIRDAVDFLGFKENPLPYYREADAFVLSSNFEGLGNVLIEALGCGTPVITTDCPYGPAEIVQNGRFGILVPVGDSDAFGEAMASEGWRRWTPDQLKETTDRFRVEDIATQYLATMTAAVGRPDRPST